MSKAMLHNYSTSSNDSLWWVLLPGALLLIVSSSRYFRRMKFVIVQLVWEADLMFWDKQIRFSLYFLVPKVPKKCLIIQTCKNICSGEPIDSSIMKKRRFCKRFTCPCPAGFRREGPFCMAIPEDCTCPCRCVVNGKEVALKVSKCLELSFLTHPCEELHFGIFPSEWRSLQDAKGTLR